MNHRQLVHWILTVEHRLLDGLLCLMLVVMIVLACLQIGLRTLFSGGLLWADSLLRYLVLWCGLLGAVVATRERKHIGIDVVGYLVPERVKPWITLVIDIFSVGIAATLTWASFIFVRNERLFGGSPLLDVPSWMWNLIFPVAFFLITFHFLFAVTEDIKTLSSPRREQEPGGEP